MNVWLRWLALSLLVLCGGSACKPDPTKNWKKVRVWGQDNYSCEVYSFGNRPACAALISRTNRNDGSISIASGADWIRVGGINVVEDGKLTIHWMNGGAHRQTVVESGPLYDALRYPVSPSGEVLEKLNAPLLDAFFAEQAK